MSARKKSQHRNRTTDGRLIPNHVHRPGRAEFAAMRTILEKAFAQGLGHHLIKPDGTHIASVQELLSMPQEPSGLSMLDYFDESKP